MRTNSSPKEPVKRTKTFSGCWTCRRRHLKCDERRPECERCVKAGLTCQGYDVKLVWTNSDGHDRPQNIRRIVETDSVVLPFPLPILERVDKVLKDLDSIKPGPEGETSGPFSVFSTEIDPSKALQLVNVSEATLADATEPIKDLDDTNDIEELDEIASSHSSSQTTIVTAESSEGLLWSFIPYQRSGWRSPDFNNRPISNMLVRHIDLLPRPAEQRLLLHHWTNFLCWHLVPVDMSDNPFRTVLTPIAMSGLLSPSHQSSGQVALFHAICATSAYSRGQLLNGDARTLVLAMKHYQLAIMHLRYSLENPEDSQRESILATIMMFSAVDMITGRSSEWRTHLQGGASWLETMDSQSWGQDRSSAVVYQSYLAIAALCNINLPGSLSIESDGWLDSRFYCLDRFFGLARQTLQHIMIMNNLVKQISKSKPDQLDALEQQLYEQTPEKLDLRDLDARSQTLSRHHAYVFYYASLIFFQRSVRQISPDDLQPMVIEAVKHLEAIEVLGRDVIGCTLVWPPFVVACECQGEELQTRMVAWYEGKRRHGFMNLQLSCQIAQEVWRRRNAVFGVNDPDVQWQDVLTDLNLDIVLA